MEDFDFTEEEIREQLEKLGYFNVDSERLLEFKTDLEKLILHEKSRDSSQSTQADGSATDSENAYRNRSPFDNTNRVSSSVNPTTYTHCQYGKENIVGSISHPGRQTKTIQPSQCALESQLLPTSDEQYDHSRVTADTSMASSASDRRVIKRRVARKMDGQSIISDELTESEMGDVSSLEDRLGHLDLEDVVPHRSQWQNTRPHSTIPLPYQQHHKMYHVKRPQSAEPTFRLPEDYDGPKALIRPMSSNPHTRNIRRNDPVSKFQQYNQCWQSQRAPGEKNHSSLRWNVREQMLYHDEVVQRKSKKVYVPNNFVVPSDKKRKNLRWAIRQDMAQGVIPPSIFD